MLAKSVIGTSGRLATGRPAPRRRSAERAAQRKGMTPEIATATTSDAGSTSVRPSVASQSRDRQTMAAISPADTGTQTAG